MLAPTAASMRIRATQPVTSMEQKDGAIIHVERGFRVAEVLATDAAGATHFIGYRVLGPGAESSTVYDAEIDARYALTQMLDRHAHPGQDA
jgi:hypothetical protein